MEAFKFENSVYLYLLAIIPILYLIRFFIKRSDRKVLKKLGNLNLIHQLIKGHSPLRKNWKFFLLNAAIAMLIIALANPQMGSKLQKVERSGADIILAIDISNSMLAEDIKPNRLSRSKLAISQLIDKLQGDRIGIIVFAGEAYTQLPITTDYGAAKMFLSTVNTDYINNQGTSIASAIELARESFKQIQESNDKPTSKAMVIITDGEDHEEGAIEAAKEAQKENIQIFTIGMGLERGAPIPLFKGNKKVGYKKNQQGETIITKLNDKILNEVSEAGGGFFVRANNSNTGLNKIFKSINSLDKTEIETKVFKEYEGWFQIYIGIALLLLIIEIIIGERKNSKWLKWSLFNEREEK